MRSEEIVLESQLQGCLARVGLGVSALSRTLGVDLRKISWMIRKLFEIVIPSIASFVMSIRTALFSFLAALL